MKQVLLHILLVVAVRAVAGEVDPTTAAAAGEDHTVHQDRSADIGPAFPGIEGQNGQLDEDGSGLEGIPEEISKADEERGDKVGEDLPIEKIYSPEGGRVYLKCHQRNWSLCRWRHNQRRCDRVPDTYSPCTTIDNTSWEKSWGCDLTLNSFTAADTGRWQAVIFSADIEEDISPLHKCVVDVSIFTRATVNISKLPKRLLAGSPQVVECKVVHGDDSEVYQYATITTSDNITRLLPLVLTNATGLYEYKPNLTDRGHIEIVCHAHQSIEGKVVHKAVSSLGLNVIYPPQPLPTLRMEMTMNNTSDMEFAISTFPLPGKDDISWHLVTTNASHSLQITSDSSHENYVLIIHEETIKDTIHVTLRIRSVTQEVFTYHQYLSVRNEAGAYDYSIDISEKRMNDETSSNVDTIAYIILSISIGSALLLILFVFAMVKARDTGKCCFKSNSKPMSSSQQEEEIPLRSQENPVSQESHNSCSGSTAGHDEKKRRQVLHSRARTPSPILTSRRKHSRDSTTHVGQPQAHVVHSQAHVVQPQTVQLKKVSVASRESTYPVV